MAVSQQALRERNLLLEDLGSSPEQERYFAYAASSVIHALTDLKQEYPEAYGKFPQLETLLQRFENRRSLDTPEAAVEFLEDIAAVGKVSERFLIDYYRRATCERYHLTNDQYEAIGRVVLELNRQRCRLFALEYSEARNHSIAELTPALKTVSQVVAIMQESLSRDRTSGLQTKVQVKRVDMALTLHGFDSLDALLDEKNQSAKVVDAKLTDNTLEFSVDAAQFVVNPFQGTFYEISKIVLAARNSANSS